MPTAKLASDGCMRPAPELSVISPKRSAGTAFQLNRAIPTAKLASAGCMRTAPELYMIFSRRFAGTGLSAEQGNLSAQMKLGDLYFSGKGVSEDTHESFRWLPPCSRARSGICAV